MSKILIAIVSTGALLFLLGCSDDDSTTSVNEEIKNSPYIFILKDTPENVCGNYVQTLINDGFVNVVTEQENDSVTCSTYNRSVGNNCATINAPDINGSTGKYACVYGYSNYTYYDDFDGYDDFDDFYDFYDFDDGFYDDFYDF